ncbi:hypothetical protein BH10CYA1_BH10CYA1_54870 [soil metagenome]
MSEMNGIDATATIRSHELSQGYPPVPVVANTAGGATKQECSDAGMSGYLEKPVDINQPPPLSPELMCHLRALGCPSNIIDFHDDGTPSLYDRELNSIL